MFSCLRRLFRTRKIEKPVTSGAAQLPKPGTSKKPLYFIDIDASGNFFARYVHVTSSVNAELIQRNGLQPLNNARERLADYLTKVFPENDAGTLIKLIADTGFSTAVESRLVNMRLDEESRGKALVALLPLGEIHYLDSADKNATLDGGEFFKAARVTVNTLLKKNAAPLYPQATPVVFIARRYLEYTGTTLIAKDVGEDDFELNLKAGVNSGFDEHWSPFRQATAIHVGTTYPPEHLVYMDKATYRAHPMEVISPEAGGRIVELLVGE